MKKGFAQIVIIAAAALLISAGFIFFFLQKNKTSEKLTPSPSPVPQYQTDETTNWKTYTNREIGIFFQYPSEWGELNVKEGQCLPEEQGPTRVYQNQPCVDIMLSAGVAENPAFLVVQSKLFSQYIPGRGASWGDMFSLATNYSGITPERYVKNYCDNPSNLYSCNVKTNPNGVLYAKSLEDEFTIESTRKALYYSILNPNENFPVILLSNQEFLDNSSLDDSEKIFDQILSTFQFIN